MTGSKSNKIIIKLHEILKIGHDFLFSESKRMQLKSKRGTHGPIRGFGATLGGTLGSTPVLLNWTAAGWG